MTIATRYFCRACGKDFGVRGTHGYRDGDGELLTECKRCGTLRVSKFRGGTIDEPACPGCGSALQVSDGTCPSCGASELYFEDINFRIPTKAVNLRGS
jgi:DNA-directed RNA polymerase subunit RPC12/RpoP